MNPEHEKHKPEEKHRLAVVYGGSFNPISSPIRILCGQSLRNGEKAAWKIASNETLDRECTVDTTGRMIRLNVWNKLNADRDNEVSTLIYTLRAYEAACKHLGIFELDEDWDLYRYTALAPATNSIYESLCNTIGRVVGPKSAKRQRYEFTPEGRAKWDAKRNGKEVEFKSAPLKPLALPKTTKPLTAMEIANKTCVMVLTIHGISNYRKISVDDIEVKDKQTDKKRLHVTKELFDRKELAAIRTKQGEAKSYVMGRVVGSELKNGVYLLKFRCVNEMETALGDFNKQIRALAIPLAAAYNRLLADSEKALGPTLFKRAEFPTADELRDAFYIEWRFVKVNTPTTKEEVSKMVWEREAKKLANTFEQAGKAATQLLAVGLTECVDEWLVRLSPEKDGKKKIIRDDSMNKIMDFLGTFNFKNIEDNEQLETLANRAREIITGVNPEVLRESQNARDFVKKGFEEVKKLTAPMIVEAPTRMISFTDD